MLSSPRKSSSGQSGVYLIELESGWKRLLLAAPDRAEWLDQFARIVGLRPARRLGTAIPKILFVARWSPEAVSQIDAAAPLEGWIGATRLSTPVYAHPASPHVVFEVRDMDDYIAGTIYPPLHHPKDARRADGGLPPSMQQVLYRLLDEPEHEAGLILHAALLRRNERGILLAGVSGVGKSTCCRRPPHPWKALADDEALVMEAHGQYVACPLPTWSDLSLDEAPFVSGDLSPTPLSIVFLLERGTPSKIWQVGQGEAVARLVRLEDLTIRLSSVLYTEAELRSKRARTFEMLSRLSLAVPTYRLRMDEQGPPWGTIEELLQSQAPAQVRTQLPGGRT